MNASALLRRPGAVATENGAIAAHYGDPLREQRLLAEGAGLVDRSDRDVVTVPGPDRNALGRVWRVGRTGGA